MRVNEQKTRLVGVLTWIIVGISSVLWEAEYRNLFSMRAAVLFGAFVLFLASFFVASRRGTTIRLRIPLIVIETLTAFTCVVLQPTGFQPVLLVILAAQLGSFPPRFAIIVVALNSIILGWI